MYMDCMHAVMICWSLPQFISLLSQVMATLFSKKMSNIKKKYTSNVLVNKLHTNLKEAMAKFYRL